MTRDKIRIILAVLVATSCLIISSYSNVVTAEPSSHLEHIGENYFTMVDDSGQIIMHTSHVITVGDGYLNKQNSLYEVYRVDGYTAYARFVEQVDMSQYLVGIDLEAVRATLAQPRAQNGTIAIYTTHSSESYLQGDGNAFVEGDGGILDVARAFATALEEQGYIVEFSDNRHEPHDAGAYNRSRRTAEELIKSQPLAIFDVHRDAGVPVEQYTGEVDNQQVARVRLVVGRQNPKQEVNDQFARQLKAVADEVHPDLLKGIFYGQGSYNQDLSNRAMLLELGTEQNVKDDAIEGISAFASVVSATIGGAGGGGTGTGETQRANDGSGRSILTLVVLLLCGGIGFLIVSTGSIDEAVKKLKQLRTSEFANYLGKLRKKKD